MAKDIKFLIGGDVSAGEQALRHLQRTGQDVCGVLDREFSQLGIKSNQAFENKRRAATIAYERIKTSGLATQEELVRAQKAFGDRMQEIDTEQFGKRAGLLQKFKANWLETTAAIGAAVAVIYKGFDLAEQAAKGLQQRAAFQQLAASKGGNADTIISQLKRVSAETISTQQLVEKAGTAMLLGIEQKHLPKLMEIARASSRITGQTMTQAFDDLSLAVARQSKMILDNLGIMIDVEKANKDYAATLGKTADQLTDAERKQAFLSATMNAGQQIIDSVGVSTTTYGERLQQAMAKMTNFKEIVGRLALSVGVALYGGFVGSVGSIHMFVGAVTWAGAKLVDLASKIPVFGGALKGLAKEMKLVSDGAFDAGQENFKTYKESWSNAFDIITGNFGKVNEKLAAAQRKFNADRATAESAAAAEAARRDASRLEMFRKTATEIINLEKKRIKDQEDLEKAHLDKLKASYATTISELNTLIDTKAALEKEMKDRKQRNSNPEVQKKDAADEYLDTLERLRKREQEVNTGFWDNPAEKAKAYNDLINAHEAAKNKVIASGSTIISQEEAKAKYSENEARLSEKINETLATGIKLKEEAAVKDAERIIQAESQLESYKSKIRELDDLLGKLPKVVEIDVKLNIQGLDSLAAVARAAGVPVSPNANPGAPAGAYSPSNTNHVPADGVGPMPQSVQAASPSPASGPVTIAPVFNFAVPAGTDAKSAKVVASEFARMVVPEIRKLNPRFA